MVRKTVGGVSWHEPPFTPEEEAILEDGFYRTPVATLRGLPVKPAPAAAGEQRGAESLPQPSTKDK